MKLILSIDAVRFPLTGIGRYTFELARHLKELPQLETLRFFSGHGFADDLPESDNPVQSAAAASTHFRGAVLKSSLAVGMYRLISPLIKSHALRGFSDHIFHGPNYYLPAFAGPSVCTFHDLSIFTWAHCHPSERVRFMRKEIKWTLKRADRLITDTEFTRQEVAAYFNFPLERIHSIPLACSGDFRPRAASEWTPLLKKLNLNLGGYSLYVGTIEPRKNLEALLDAYAMLPKAMRMQWPLVLTGHPGWKSAHLHARIEAAERQGWARYLGFVKAEELPLIYAGARLFVFPSLYEGFGLPLVEAMASGIPVVCSNASTLPEVAGDAALMCAPQDVDALSRLIATGLEDETWRAETIQKGLLRAAGFSWQSTAQKTAEVYREMAS